MPEEIVAIVEYRVRAEDEARFPSLIRSKWRFQMQQGYISPGARLAEIVKESGLYIEMFSWTSNEAIDRAHDDPVMAQLWDALDEATHGGRWEGIRIRNGKWA